MATWRSSGPVSREISSWLVFGPCSSRQSVANRHDRKESRPCDSPPRMTAMRSLSKLPDHALRQDLAAAAAHDRGATADLLSHIAEFDARRLYLPAGYPSMHLYCVHELRMSEDSALKRCRAARAGREFPAVFEAVSDGRLHLSAVVMLATHLTRENAKDLLAAATHKTKAEIALLLAERFPRTDVPESLRSETASPVTHGRSTEPTVENALSPAPGQVDPPPTRPVVAPLSPGRFELRATLDQEAHDLLRYAKSLLGHAIPSGDLTMILKRALKQLVEAEEKRVFAACARTRPRRGAPKGRYVPAEVRRSVWVRDGGQCTFTSESGRRCPSSDRLEFDHVQPVARGGESTVANLRLCCRAHNQYQAERTFGAGFMARKRADARTRRARRPSVEPHDSRDEVIARLLSLGFPPDEARLAAALGDLFPGAPVEELVQIAVSALRPERDLSFAESPSPAA